MCDKSAPPTRTGVHQNQLLLFFFFDSHTKEFCLLVLTMNVVKKIHATQKHSITVKIMFTLQMIKKMTGPGIVVAIHMIGGLPMPIAISCTLTPTRTAKLSALSCNNQW